ncbi:MAG TPA: hypothetical protein VIK32_15690 [Candidatus Limnocylindrales bacterium]
MITLTRSGIEMEVRVEAVPDLLRQGWHVAGKTADETTAILDTAATIGVSAALGEDVTAALVAFAATLGITLSAS